jgi:SAM-dependent methyltransferase
VPGWINADITPHIFVAKVPGAATVLHELRLMADDRYDQHKAGIFREVRYIDVKKRFPFADNEIDNVFSSHMLKHLHPQDAERCLRETHRVLKPGGVARIVVPDLELALKTFDRENPEPFLEAMYTTKQSREKNRHQWMYTGPSLTKLLRACGFAEAHVQKFREGRCPDLDRLDNRPEESLFVEAIK